MYFLSKFLSTVIKINHLLLTVNYKSSDVILLRNSTFLTNSGFLKYRKKRNKRMRQQRALGFGSSSINNTFLPLSLTE